MAEEPRQKRTKLGTFARIIQIITGISIITGIIIRLVGLYNAHKQAGLALGVYLSPELSDFREIFRHYERLGAKVKLQYIDMDLIFEVIPFPDKYWEKTKDLRCRIQYNWYGKGRELTDFGTNFLYLKEFYEGQRGTKSFPYLHFLARLDQKLADSGQVIIVINEQMKSYHAKVWTLDKQQGTWQPVFRPTDAYLGEAGLATPAEKREGDLKKPIGIYPLKRAFGYAPEIPSKMPHTQVKKEDIWESDSQSAEYNKLVKRGKTCRPSLRK